VRAKALKVLRAAADEGGVDPKTPDPQTVIGVVEELRTSSEDERDELLSDLLCHVYGSLASQNS
jgi:hypothetical protein